MKKIRETIEFIANENDIGKRLDIFLNENIEDATRSYIEKLIDGENVLFNDKIIKKNGKKLKGTEKIIVNIPFEEEMDLIPEDIDLDIIYEDEDIIAINKQANLVVHPAFGNSSGTLVNALLFHVNKLSDINGYIRPGIVHRLDKDTSGIILIAKNNKAHAELGEMFSSKTIKKRYLCIVKGMFSEENKSSRIETLIGRDSKDRKKMTVTENRGKNAITNYKVVDSSKNYSLVEVGIETGRTHQIRVHMKYLNHPILGDSVYGNPDKEIKRQMLHAYQIEFNHPINGKEMKIEAKLPQDFVDACNKFGLDISNYKK